ncbi:lanthionine synthetase C family protein [Streptomyces sp. H39-C1]|uniref:lanthionine synthetase C family protein n=1 Tax=Streptomyces sp. H39-C1 TaxID=3004355 RepID=UPI0022AFC1B3|nr:lanthionine synthetase C family protein [Streptomyces sp. H39-C1]MCZ4098293.1 lanthionine synthetase C family protein [Streptomyces sp. H39-C1]
MTHPLALKTAGAVADLLANPATAPLGPDASLHRQHLAYGPTGIALLHVERAAAGLGPWQRAHDWLAAAARQPFTSGLDSHPFYGAPALAHTMACVTDHLPGTYQRALSALDRQMGTDTRRRLEAAHRRIDAGRLPEYAEFDTIRGLAGYGTFFLRRDPTGPDVRAVLDYCVRLTEPVTYGGEALPGWWTLSGPSGRQGDRFPGGHSNHGMAHGVGGVLALLALAARRGITVGGHREAVATILAWLDRWQEQTERGDAWPYWITRDELRSGRTDPSPPRRPSWCYGTAGLARARQLAALALGDTRCQVEAENALVSALTDHGQLKATTDNGMCHGFAGLAHIASRVADDAHSSTAGQLRAAIPPLLAAACPPGTVPEEAARSVVQDHNAGPGFLNGAAGMALALLAPATSAPPQTAWDACLLIA